MRKEIPKAILFDWDMTLVDSLNALESIYKEFFQRLNITPKLELKKITGMNTKEILDNLKKNHKNELESYDKNSLKKTLKSIFEKNINKFEFKGDVLKDIKEELQDIKIGILSNNSIDIINHFLKKNNIDLDIIITDENNGSDKQESILIAATSLKIKTSEIIYVGDHPNDIKAANSAGATSVALVTVMHSEKELREYHPDYIIKDIKEIKNIVKKMKNPIT